MIGDTFELLVMKTEALQSMKRAWEAGHRDSEWGRRDPDHSLLHGEPEFERLYPPPVEDS